MCELWAVERRVVVDGRGGEHSNSEETGTVNRVNIFPHPSPLVFRNVGFRA